MKNPIAINKLNMIKVENVKLQRTLIRKKKIQSKDCEKIFANHRTDCGSA